MTQCSEVERGAWRWRVLLNRASSGVVSKAPDRPVPGIRKIGDPRAPLIATQGPRISPDRPHSTTFLSTPPTTRFAATHGSLLCSHAVEIYWGSRISSRLSISTRPSHLTGCGLPKHRPGDVPPSSVKRCSGSAPDGRKSAVIARTGTLQRSTSREPSTSRWWPGIR